MTLRDALERIAPHLRDEICVHSNGHLSRAAFGVRDVDTSFYMIGSMGLASSIGLGTLATIAAVAPPNLLHLCFDNSAHASTGSQPTISDRVALETMARAAGYRWTGRVESPDALDEALPGFLTRPGPAFLLVRIALGPAGAPGPRIPWTPAEMTARLRRTLGSE